MSEPVSGLTINELARLAQSRCSNSPQDIANWGRKMNRFDSAADIYKMCLELLDLRNQVRQVRNIVHGTD